MRTEEKSLDVTDGAYWTNRSIKQFLTNTASFRDILEQNEVKIFLLSDVFLVHSNIYVHINRYTPLLNNATYRITVLTKYTKRKHWEYIPSRQVIDFNVFLCVNVFYNVIFGSWIVRNASSQFTYQSNLCRKSAAVARSPPYNYECFQLLKRLYLRFYDRQNRIKTFI